ncbi:MAG: GTP-binding protein, partial [Isosphaeraceae bacterium]
VNLVDRRGDVELSLPSGGRASDAELIINARVTMDPTALEDQVVRALEWTCVRFELSPAFQALRSFRLGRPVPVHRIVSLEDQIARS